MPYLLLTPSVLFWRSNYFLGRLLVQGADPILMTDVSWASNSVMLYQRHINNVKSPLPHYIGSKLLIFTLYLQVHSVDLQPISAQGKAIYMASRSLIVLIINRLISHVRLSQRYSRSTDELLRLSHGNLSHASLLNRFSYRELSIMESAKSQTVYCPLLNNILLTG